MGFLTGKYNEGEIPEDSRLGKEKAMMKRVIDKYFGEKKQDF